MTTYKPYGIEELQGILDSARQQKLPILTWRQRQVGLGLDFCNWNRVVEIDKANMMVVVERAVTMGQLEQELNAHGLHFGPATQDLEEVTIGEFYRRQLPSLTTACYGQPKLLVQGIEAALIDGRLLQAGGKTIKNVTGYDLCRLLLSSGEQLAIPLSFILRIHPLPESEQSCILFLHEPEEWSQWLFQLQKLAPDICVTWRQAEQAMAKGWPILLVFRGKDERIQQKITLLQEQVRQQKATLQLLSSEELAQCWLMLKAMRISTCWPDGLKIPLSKMGQWMVWLDDQQLSCWSQPLAGNVQMLVPEPSAELYHHLVTAAVALGGAGNASCLWQYGQGDPIKEKFYRRIKEQFDGENRLNPQKQRSEDNGFTTAGAME